jgi:hypothetical protein
MHKSYYFRHVYTEGISINKHNYYKVVIDNCAPYDLIQAKNVKNGLLEYELGKPSPRND